MPICKYCNKNYYSKYTLINHELRCIKNSNRQVKEKSPDIVGYCSFCGKECKNDNSLRNHERLCKSNPDRQLTSYEQTGISHLSNKGWAKGLTKDTDIRIARMSKALKEGYSSGRILSRRGCKFSLEARQHLSQKAREKNFEQHFGRRKIFEYAGHKFISSYEVVVAQSLDEHQINWEQLKRIPYKDLNGKLHYYTPDLYLPDFDIYLEPKNDYLINNVNPTLGYRDIDKIKWVEEYNNIKVLLLNKDQLKWEVIQKLIEELK